MADNTGPALEKKIEHETASELEELSLENCDPKSPGQTETPGHLSEANFQFAAKKGHREVLGHGKMDPNTKISPERLSQLRELRSTRKGSTSFNLEKESLVTADYAGKPQTILDRLVSWIAAQVKKLQELFLRSLGIAPSRKEEKLEEELQEAAVSPLAKLKGMEDFERRKRENSKKSHL